MRKNERKYGKNERKYEKNERKNNKSKNSLFGTIAIGSRRARLDRRLDTYCWFDYVFLYFLDWLFLDSLDDYFGLFLLWLFVPHKHLMHDPRMIRQLFHRNTRLSVDIETTVQHVETAIGQRLLDIGLESVLTLLDQLDGLVVVRAFEGEVAVKHAVEDDPARPYVNSAVYFVVF